MPPILVSHHMEPAGAVPQLLAAAAFRRKPPQSKWWWDRVRACIIFLMSLGTFQQPGKQIACRYSKGQGCHQLSEAAGSNGPIGVSLCSSGCQHRVLSSSMGWAFLGSSGVSFQWESLLTCHVPGELSPQTSKDRTREAQRDNVYSSELLEAPRHAAAGRVAGGKPNWSQQSFSSTGVSHTGVTRRN